MSLSPGPRPSNLMLRVTLALTLSALPAAAQLTEITVAGMHPDQRLESFTSQPDGPIAATHAVFTALGVERCELYGTFQPMSDVMSSSFGNALCSRGNVLTVCAPGGAIDNPGASGGNGWRFTLLPGTTASQVAFTIVDEGFGSPLAQVRVYRGGILLGTLPIANPSIAPHYVESAQPFDVFEIGASSFAGGWAIDEIIVAGFGPGCVINAPLAGATVSGDVTLTHDVGHTTGLPVVATYEFSTDAGVTFALCTPAPGSANPSGSLTTPTLGVAFIWDSVADGVGLVIPQATLLQVRVDDGMRTSSCRSGSFTVDNVAPAPTCTLTLLTTPPVSGVADVELVPSSTLSATLEATVTWSSDGGTTWQNGTPDAGSVNPMTGLTSGATVGFGWDSRADGVALGGAVAGILVRVTVDDGVAPLAGICTSSPFTVDNSSLCGGICGDCDLGATGPTILDALVAAQIGAGLITPSAVQLGCCDVDSSMAVTVIDALRIAQAAAGLVVVLTCP